jgi:DNA repair protein RadA/Sms
MATRTRTVFFCSDCGNEASRWSGQCAVCGAWNTLVEQPAASRQAGGRARSKPAVRIDAVRLGDVSNEGQATRFGTGVDEFDFVLGGGIVPGSIILIGGEPGIGKSTLLLQVAARLEGTGRGTLYVSGEESPRQVGMRGERLAEDTSAVTFLAATGLDSILDAAEPPLVPVADGHQARGIDRILRRQR